MPHNRMMLLLHLAELLIDTFAGRLRTLRGQRVKAWKATTIFVVDLGTCLRALPVRSRGLYASGRQSYERE